MVLNLTRCLQNGACSHGDGSCETALNWAGPRLQTKPSGNQVFGARPSGHVYPCILASMDCQHQPAHHVHCIGRGICIDDCRKRTQLGAFERAPEICASDFVGVGDLLRSWITHNQIRMTVVAPIDEQRYRPVSTPRVHKEQLYKMQL